MEPQIEHLLRGSQGNHESGPIAKNIGLRGFY